jgi:hypothetical protein
MNKIIVAAAAASMLLAGSLPALAAHKTVEQTCKTQAQRHHLTGDKMEAYIKSCVEKHHKAEKPAAPAK